VNGHDVAAPSPFVVEHLPLAPAGRAFDVACGAGRHALALGRLGRVVEAVDSSYARCRDLRAAALAEGLRVHVVCADLERWPLCRRRYAVIVNTLYLDRALVPGLIEALVPGGLLLFETFTAAQLASGHPRNPAFVLQPGELLRLASGMRIVAHREGPVERDGRTVHLASLAAYTP
jgi:SAM-dependent methyltransferase